MTLGETRILQVQDRCQDTSRTVESSGELPGDACGAPWRIAKGRSGRAGTSSKTGGTASSGLEKRAPPVTGSVPVASPLSLGLAVATRRLLRGGPGILC